MQNSCITQIPACTLLQRCDNRGVIQLKQDMVVLKVPTKDQRRREQSVPILLEQWKRRPTARAIEPEATIHLRQHRNPAFGLIRLHCNGREQATDSGKQTLTVSSLDKSDPPPDIRSSLLVQPNVELQLLQNR